MERPVKGDVVVIPFPFSDLSGAKRRPALVVAEWGGEDVMLCQITSRTRSDGFVVPLNDSDFEAGGLPVSSNIRPNKIFTADVNTIITTAGHVSNDKYKDVVENIIRLIK